MTVQDYKIHSFNFGMFRLDGGSMFGAVPKTLWSKKAPADERNRIKLATRSLIIEHADRVFLIDVGNGDKWSEKLRDIYAIENTPRSEWPEVLTRVTDIILTHLHFDHAGGISSLHDGVLALTFPKAKIHLQRANWENARAPSVRERASYLPDHVFILEQADLNLVDGDTEIYPGITLHRVDGHTVGQQWIEVKTHSQHLFYTTDLVPTSHHVHLPFHMGFDICVASLLKEKEAFLTRVAEEKGLLFFEHDPEVVCGAVVRSEEGVFEFQQRVWDKP